MPVTMLLPGMVEIQPYMSQVDIERIGRLKAKDYIINWFKQRIPTYKDGLPNIASTTPGSKVMVLKSGTGSGKSVTIGPELYLNFPALVNKYIAITQPRILTTLEVTNKIKEAYNAKLIPGTNLGYQTKDFYIIPKRGVILMIEEVLAIQLSTMTDKQFMDRYSFVILDECHNRTSSMDISMFLLKKLITRQYRDPLCPFLILTSATLDVNKYGNYFGVKKENIISIKGFNYDVKEVFQETEVGNYIEKTAQTAIDIHVANKDDYKGLVYDILIFTASESDIKKISKILEKNNDEENMFMVIVLTSERYKKGESYRDIIKPITSINIVKDGRTINPRRRIILSTNVAETGLTLDYLKYVIDTGYSNQLIFDPIYGDTIFIKKHIARSNAMQRRGRVGRVAAGVWYPMYTEQVFKNMEEDLMPDVIITDMTLFTLTLIIKYTFVDWNGLITNNNRPTGVFNIEEIQLIDNISADSYSYSMEKLFVLGLIDSNYIPSPLGLSCVKFRGIGLETILLVLNGYIHECNIKDIITIAAFSSTSVSSYIDIKSRYEYTNISCGTSLYPYDDFIEPIFIWDIFTKKVENSSLESIQVWCLEQGFVYNSLLYISTVIDDIIFSLTQNIGLDISYNGLKIQKNKYNLGNLIQNDPTIGIQEIKKIKKCIYESYRFNTATWSDSDSKYIINNTGKKIFVKSCIFNIKDAPLDRPASITVGHKIVKKEEESFLFTGSNVSVLEGYVNIDDTFIVS